MLSRRPWPPDVYTRRQAVGDRPNRPIIKWQKILVCNSTSKFLLILQLLKIIQNTSQVSRSRPNAHICPLFRPLFSLGSKMLRLNLNSVELQCNKSTDVKLAFCRILGRLSGTCILLWKLKNPPLWAMRTLRAVINIHRWPLWHPTQRPSFQFHCRTLWCMAKGRPVVHDYWILTHTQAEWEQYRW